VLEIRLCANEADKELSLAMHNERMPEEAVSRHCPGGRWDPLQPIEATA
jgi:hypothetical protein